MDIFKYSWEEKVRKYAPLARRMTPRSLEEFSGQEHLLGEGRALRRLIEEDLLSSVIFYGPPGTGKTALSRIIEMQTKSSFSRLNAVMAGVKEVREIVDEARINLSMQERRTILYIDEIHRFNKIQQDALLPAMEEGIICLIGATTENPCFSIIPPLLSRSQIFTFESLSPDAIKQILERALNDKERGLGCYDVKIEKEALDYLVKMAEGDARVALNALEAAVISHAGKVGKMHLSLNVEHIRENLSRKNLRYDADGEYHYNVISAFIKSIRGSDPDAALFWLARMLESGEDPLFISRRLIISASEDIGNADPQALIIAVSAAQAVQQLGLPEGRLTLAQATAYLATAPKSNAVCLAFNEAQSYVKKCSYGDVPLHLRDASYQGALGLGHGQEYLFPHDYTEHFVPQNYMPPGLEHKIFYKPGEQGQEKEIGERLKRWRLLMGRPKE